MDVDEKEAAGKKKYVIRQSRHIKTPQ